MCAAPEILEDSGSYSPLCDLWSIGVIAFALLCGEFPYKAKGRNELRNLVTSPPSFSAQRWENVPETAKVRFTLPCGSTGKRMQ